MTLSRPGSRSQPGLQHDRVHTSRQFLTCKVAGWLNLALEWARFASLCLVPAGGAGRHGARAFPGFSHVSNWKLVSLNGCQLIWLAQIVRACLPPAGDTGRPGA